MVNEVDHNNFFLINAPAGSGKTTTIETMISDILNQNINSGILCITYTNRAVDELVSRIEAKNVQIQTIHSFISSFMGIYFTHKEILNLYFEIYGDKIKSRIKNIDNDEKVAKSNEKYYEKFGKLDYETIKRNINKIEYNELSNNTLYYGGLSHYDLLYFSMLMIERYPVIKKRISWKYQYIFIDEYQDTSSNVLKIFYQAVKGTNTKLYLFGDSMQQIYKNYDGTFQKELAFFDTSKKLETNYRSTPFIVKVLNQIYNDPEFEQNPNEDYEQCENERPRVLICENIDLTLKVESEKNPEALKLYIFNSQRFDAINAGNLYREVKRMEKYSFGRKYNPVDILTNNSKDNPDELFRILFFIREIYKDYKVGKYGTVIQSIKRSSFMNKDMLKINKHSDKKIINEKLSIIFRFFNHQEEHTIEELLRLFINESLVYEQTLSEILNNKEYEKVLSIPLDEFVNVCEYLENPRVSTQHGVKGEGHDSVFFIAEDSNRTPIVKMYDFFSIWSKISISFTEFQNFYYAFSDKVKKLLDEISIKKSNDLNRKIFEDNKELINSGIQKINADFKDNKYFIEIYSKDFNEYFEKPGVGNTKKCMNINPLHGIFSAYKLFYVGCSRAKKSLTIFVDKNKINGDKLKIENKFREIGFKVINC